MTSLFRYGDGTRHPDEDANRAVLKEALRGMRVNRAEYQLLTLLIHDTDHVFVKSIAGIINKARAES